MIISTLSTYDMDKYEILAPVSGMSVHSISFFRNIFAGLSGLFGGKNTAIQTKFMDVRRESINEMKTAATDIGADMIAGLQIELTELGQEFVVCIATGTALKKKDSKKLKGAKLSKQDSLLASPQK